MKSRLAVSCFFILIASTFTSDAIADFKRLSSWAGEICRCRAVDVLGKRHVTANQPEASAISPQNRSLAFISAEDTKVLAWLEERVQGVVSKVVKSNYDCAAFALIRTAATRMHEALRLMRIQYATR